MGNGAPTVRERRLPRGLVLLGGAAAAVVVLAGCSAAAWLIGPLFLALVIVIVINPIPHWLRRHHVPSWLATMVLVVLVYAVIASLVGILVVSVAQLATLLSHYAGQADGVIAQATAQLRRWGVTPDQARTVANGLDLRHLARFVGTLLGSIASIGTSVVFLLSLLLFLSVDAATVDIRRAGLAVGRPELGDALRAFVRGTRRYMLVTTIFGLIVAALDTIGLVALGVSLPVLWGVLAFMTNYIPNVGFVLGLLPPVVLGTLQGGWQVGLAVVVLYGVLNFVVQSLIQPRFVGNAVGLSTTATFVSLVLWSWILGPLGAILAVPLTLLAKALLVDSDSRAAWVTALVGSIPGNEARRRTQPTGMTPNKGAIATIASHDRPRRRKGATNSPWPGKP